jgi:hypothetical protein
MLDAPLVGDAIAAAVVLHRRLPIVFGVTKGCFRPALGDYAQEGGRRAVLVPIHLCLSKISCPKQSYDIVLVRAAADAEFLVPERDYACNCVSSSHPDPIARFGGYL